MITEVEEFLWHFHDFKTHKIKFLFVNYLLSTISPGIRELFKGCSLFCSIAERENENKS
jgi:hypothetical protein